MIISIDATGLGATRTGTTVYLIEILRVWSADPRITHRFVVFASPKTHGYFAKMSLDDRYTIHAAPDNRALRIVWQQFLMPFLIRKYHCNVHWGSGFVLPLLSSCPSVVTVHDLTVQLFPEVHEPIKRWYFPWMIGRAVKKAQAVITISETTKRDLLACYAGIARKTQVTLLAARYLPADMQLVGKEGQGRYILAIGTIEPRKNLARLIRAWIGIDMSVRGDARLLIAGAYGWKANHLRIQAEQTEGAGIEVLGFVDELELARLLKNAVALAYPSLYEGFGLPVLEAMSMGVPVLTSATDVAQEVAADAALFVDSRDEQSIRHGLERLLVDPHLREQLRQKGKTRAKQFSWERTATQTLDILERVAT